VSEMWNSVARGWEEAADTIKDQLAAATDALLDAAQISKGDAVLDLACGAGGAGLAAAERVGDGGMVLLSDSASEMVAAAARRSRALPQVSTAVFDQCEIAAEQERFDAVIIRHGLMFVDDPAAAVAEAARVLRPGGSYAAMTWGPRAQNPWVGLILDAVGEQFGVPFPPAGVRGPFSLDDGAQLASVLEAGGLRDVSVQRIEARCEWPRCRPGGSACHASQVPLRWRWQRWSPTFARRSSSGPSARARALRARTETGLPSPARCSSAAGAGHSADHAGSGLRSRDVEARRREIGDDRSDHRREHEAHLAGAERESAAMV
jgi:SAM-dependent methyltransferase